jgi:hypothetical protein
MAKPSLDNISANNTFQVWLDRTNELIDITKTETITASVLGDSTGSLAVPLSAILIGSFTANTVIAETILRTDSISPKIGSTGISISSPITVNSSTQTASTFVSTVGPRNLFNTGTSSWRIGFEDQTTNRFIIDSGVGDRKFAITTTGNVTITGSMTAPAGFIGNVNGNASSATILETERTIAMSGDVVWNSGNFNGSDNVTSISTIQDNVVSNAKLRQSAGLSIIGRTANTTGNVADIVAATDHQVFRRSGTSVGFGAISLNQAAAVTGILSVSNGGSGNSTFVSGQILFGNGTSAIATKSNLFWDNTNNRLGINVTPTQALNVGGNILATGDITAFSDERLKTNIVKIENAMEKLSQIRGVFYDKDDRRGTGVIAQEVEAVLPEAVHDGEFKSVAYGNMIGLIIEAIKELKEEIDSIKNANKN